MATIKKKDIKKYKTKEEEIQELVDSDGSPIEGSETHNNDSEIEVPNAQTSDEFQAQAIGPRSIYNMYGGTPYSRGSRSGISAESVELSEMAKNKMRKMVEDHLTKQGINRDMVKKYNDISDVNRNGIPDIEDMVNKPMITRELKNFVNKISRITLNGEEKGIALNYILQNINTEDIPSDYKRLIAQSLR